MSERVSLSEARRLREAGYPQNSKFKWWITKATPQGFLSNKTYIDSSPSVKEKVAAPCACEILEKLPKRIKIGGSGYYLKIHYEVNGVGVYYHLKDDLPKNYVHRHKLTPALVELYCWLSKEKLLGDEGGR